MKNTKNNSFEVRLSRMTILAFMSMAALFLILGIDFLFFHFIFNDSWEINDVPFFVDVLGFIFFIIVPIVIIYKQLQYIVHPPLMMYIDKNFVSFGHGMDYEQYKIPTKYLLSVGRGLAAPSTSTLRPEQFLFGGGVRLKFESHKDIPWGKITSAGLVFQNYNLTIKRLYANKSTAKIIDGVTPFISNRKTL
jgi:hypothetical protein